MSWGQVLFGFSGRINRGKYWFGVVFWLLVYLVAWVVVFAIIGSRVPEFSEDNIAAIISALGMGLLVMVIVTIPMVISGFALGIKRLHDRNKSGWWILLFYFGPSVLASIAATSDTDAAVLVLNLASFVIAIWGLVELGFLRGTVGSNQYGPDPLEPAAPPLPAR
jgi:uncharacterized membrane protein YhaH (DUF805 family)